MTTTLLPPRGSWVERDVLYNHDLPEKAGWFYAQLKGLSWQNEGKTTPWLMMSELVEMTGRHKTAIYGYMTSLRTINALRWRTSGEGRFMFSFPLAENSAFPEMPDSSLRDKEDIESVNNDDSPEIRKSGKMTPEIRAQLDVFTGRFGKFFNRQEIDRYLALVSDHGPDKIREVLQWAERKEAHLTNRPALLDTLETAAANWNSRKEGKNVPKPTIYPDSPKPTETDLASARKSLANRRRIQGKLSPV
jgi:hypothetical protein